ncbi:hypothetical protein CDL15_Pgr014556 [Punica granatum]|uniref:Uncharacterized protein n=1 Tax=Punica granatum TaxID=22663 RepID=A0A218WEB5_PUNGR|nr:hypothetical protein CDL15_Pgr014556 [Punica granatum]
MWACYGPLISACWAVRVTMSPTHLWSREWKPNSEGNYHSEKLPIDQEGYWGSGSDLPTIRMVDNILGQLGPKVYVLNIT